MDLESLDGGVRLAAAGDVGRSELAVSGDRTVSRLHVSLSPRVGEGVVAFEVVGKNPILVFTAGRGGGRMFRRAQSGELAAGDRISLSLKSPSFWVVKRAEGELEDEVIDAVERRERRTRERREKEKEAELVIGAAEELPSYETDEDEGDEGVDAGSANLPYHDPVKEFGFLVIGHEFDSYPRGKIRPIKEWNWFLEEMKESEDEDDDQTSKRRSKRNPGRRKGIDDDDWSGEDEDEKASVSKASAGGKRPKYSTRSKDPKKAKMTSTVQRAGPVRPKNSGVREDLEDGEEDDDETLGGFIVGEDNETEAEESMDELEGEEDEFDDEEEDD